MVVAVTESQLLSYIEFPYHAGRCPNPTHRGHACDVLSLDVIDVELRVADGVVQEAWWFGYYDPSTLCRVGASLLMEWSEGKTLDEVGGLAQDTYLEWIGIPASNVTTRRSWVLVPWNAVQAAIRNESVEPSMDLRPALESGAGGMPSEPNETERLN